MGLKLAQGFFHTPQLRVFSRPDQYSLFLSVCRLPSLSCFSSCCGTAAVTSPSLPLRAPPLPNGDAKGRPAPRDCCIFTSGEAYW